MADPDDRPFLDRPAARLLALLVIVLCAGLLAYLHRDDLSAAPMGGTSKGTAPADDPAAPCLGQRFAEIDAMVSDGVIDEEKAALFKERADAMCRATSGDGSADPPLPGIPPAE